MTRPTEQSAVTLLLTGDVMTGRGVDQILPHSCPPDLYEPWVNNAEVYVRLAERKSGPIARPVDFDYVWGNLPAEIDRFAPDARIVNLETAITVSETPWPDKGINYRMHPGNIPVLTAAGVDAAVLANNHVLDWGRPGLEETQAALHRAKIASVGAGADRDKALAPCTLPLPQGCRLLIFAAAVADSGVPPAWAASRTASGVNFLPDLYGPEAEEFLNHVGRFKGPRTIIVVSLHWGPNWGHQIPQEQSDFAQSLIVSAGVDLVHGHSSHHPKGLEIYRGRLILYGCGDLLNDYEGIETHPEVGPDLGLLYFPRLDTHSGELLDLHLVPSRTRRFRLGHPPREEVLRLADILNRQSRNLGPGLEVTAEGVIALKRRQRRQDRATSRSREPNRP